MLRRFITGGIIAAVVAAGFLLTFLLKNEAFEKKLAESAVPRDAILYLDNIDYTYITKEFRSKNKVYIEALRDQQIQEYDSLFGQLISTIGQVPLLTEIAENGNISISFHLQGKSKLKLLFILEPDPEIKENDIHSALEVLFGRDAIVNNRKYEAVNLYDVSLPAIGPVRQLSYSVIDGLVLISSSSLLVEEAIRTVHSGSGIISDVAFREVSKTAGKYVQANVYLNYRRIPSLFDLFFGRGDYSLTADFGVFAEWGAMDLDVQADAIILNGMTVVRDSASQWLDIFSSQSPVKTDILSFVPANAVSFFSAGLSDPQAFYKRFQQHYRNAGKAQELLSAERKMTDLYKQSPLQDLLGIMKNELVRFTIDPDENGVFSEVSIIEVSSHSRALELLAKWLGGYASKSGLTQEDYISTYILDSQTSYQVFKFPEDFYTGIPTGSFFGRYMTVYDNFVIASDNRRAIERTIYQNVLHKTLVNEPGYESYSDFISSRSNLTWIIRPFNYLESAGGRLTPRGKELFDRFEDITRKMPGLIFQVMNEGELFYGILSLKYSGQVKEKALTVWESLLDSVITSKPVLVENHYTREKEIMVQDAGNTLYLLNSTGRILWKVKLEEQILSNIYQVDYYRNDKLQYLFNTKSALHLIDRNGNYVERYPVNLRADATNGMALFDYDKSRDYRIAVACADKDIYLYDLEGNIVPGWSFRKSDGVIKKPLQHFRIEDRDYIVASDAIRTYILNRRGKERVKIKDMPVVSENNAFYIDMNTGGGQPRLVTTSEAGQVIAIDFAGETGVLYEREMERDHFFRLEDFDQDGVLDYLFADKDQLEVLSSDGSSIFTFRIKNNITMLPDVYQFSATDMKIGITDIERNYLYLLNSDGSVYEGFPLEGSTRFSIGYFAGSDSRFNLIVGNRNGFLYNYSIE